jgi:hypothetical protein
MNLPPPSVPTLSLNKSKSFGVIVSALAMTGIKLTLVPSLFIVSISNGFKLMYQDKMAKKKRLSVTWELGTDDLPNPRMSGRSYKVQTRMNSHVDLVLPVRLLFLTHVGFVLIIEEIDDRCPAKMETQQTLINGDPGLVW